MLCIPFARNFQVTLPRDVREIKDLQVGDKVLFVVEGERVDLVKLDKNVVNIAAGLWSEMKETGLAYEQRMRNGHEKHKRF